MSLQQRVTALAEAIATDIRNLRDTRGTMATLSTTEKSSLVGAVNELYAAIQAIDTSAIIDDDAPSLVTTYSSTKIAADIAAAVAALVNSSPAALDTLQELAAALGNDANFAATVSTALGERVAVTAQTFTGPQQTQARANISAASVAEVNAVQTNLDDFEAEVGNTDHNFVTDYTTVRDA
jgi:hypothetical protein